MSSRVDPASQPADHRRPCPRKRAGKPLGLLPAIDRAATRADDGDRHLVPRFQTAAAIEHARRIADLGEHPRILGRRFSHQPNVGLPAALNLADRRVRISMLDDRRRQLGSDPVDLLQLGEARLQDRGRSTKGGLERLLQARADARNQIESQSVDQVGIVGLVLLERKSGRRWIRHDGPSGYSAFKMSESTDRTTASGTESTNSTWPIEAGNTNRSLPRIDFLSSRMRSSAASTSSELGGSAFGS